MNKEPSADEILDEILDEIREEKSQEAAPAPADNKEDDALKAELEQVKAELAAEKDKYMRILAEYDNFRRRSKQERDNIYADVRGDTVKKFLAVYDNLSRAAEFEKDEEAKQGAVAILNQFKTVLSDLGVTEIPALGQRFDPSLHDAVLHIDDEKYGEGEIVLELAKGFKLGDKVIRFSTVQVAN